MAIFLGRADCRWCRLRILRVFTLLKVLETLPSCALKLLQALGMGLERACLGSRMLLIVSK